MTALRIELGGWRTMMAEAESRLTMAFVAPLVVFLLISTFEPKFSGDDRFSHPAATTAVDQGPSVTERQSPAPLSRSAVAKTHRYLAFVWLKLLIVGGMLVYFAPTYRRIAGNVSLAAIPVGVVGFFLWIGLCQVGLEQTLAARLGWGAQVAATRSHFDPYVAFPAPLGRGLFLFARLTLLVVLVPLAEELFLRGFLMRYFQNPDWPRQSFSQFSFWPLAAGTLYGVLTHPAEALAAAAWFSLITWLMVRTGSFWNCVMAHAVTNGLLGLYVLLYAQWQLW